MTQQILSQKPGLNLGSAGIPVRKRFVANRVNLYLIVVFRWEAFVAPSFWTSMSSHKT